MQLVPHHPLHILIHTPLKKTDTNDVPEIYHENARIKTLSRYPVPTPYG